MASYSVNLPLQLQQAVEQCAKNQGISLDQFILWAITEKVTVLQQQFYDPAFPHITYRQGANGEAVAIIQGTGIRVQTIVIAAYHWGMSSNQIAEEYGLTELQINNALRFYTTHQAEIDTAIANEQAIEAANV